MDDNNVETRKDCSLAFQLGVSIPSVAVNSPLAPLRSDSGEPPGSGKMVSLADLHVQSKTPPIQSCVESQVGKETLLLSCRKGVGVWVEKEICGREKYMGFSEMHPSIPRCVAFTGCGPIGPMASTIGPR